MEPIEFWFEFASSYSYPAARLTMHIRVQKWGNSLAVRIPKPLAEDAKVEEGTVLNLAVSEGKVIATPVKKKAVSPADASQSVQEKPARGSRVRCAGRTGGLVVARRYVPARGDAIWLTFTPQAGHERAGRRPALVLSPASYNGKVGLAILCPITSQVKGYSFEVATPASSRVGGVILADQVKSLDWRVRQAEFICKRPRETTVEVLGKLGALLFDAS
jgi:mRNA interferase MazF